MRFVPDRALPLTLCGVGMCHGGINRFPNGTCLGEDLELKT